MKELRPYQTKAIADLRASLASGHKRPVLQLSTGGGKTIIASEIIKMAREKGRRVIFTCPAIELIDQTARAFYNHGITDLGVMQAQHPMTDPSKPVQIASIQTLARRDIPPASLVLVDECHRMFSFVTDWMGMDDWARVPFIGLSATPWAKGMGRLWDHLIICATTDQMIADGWLSPFRVFAPSHPDLTGVKTLAGDYHEGQLSEAMQKGAITADIVTTWLERAEGRSTICFAVDRAHARSIAEAFEKAGVRCGYMDANTPRDERDEIRKEFERGNLQVVSNVGVLTTGVDWDVRCIILARPTKSEMLYVQMIGRGLRTANGKADCLILDHSDTTLRLGFVTDIHHHKLNDGTIAKAVDGSEDEPETPKPKECPSCGVLKAPKVRKCPACGFEPQAQSQVEVIQGELVELGAHRKAMEASMAEKTKFFAELQGYSSEKNYKPGWAANQYKQRYGVWPNHPSIRYAMPIEPSGGTLSWIRSRQIAYAKAKEKAATA